MSRKHNTTHARGRSNYPERLKRRGVTSRTVHMADLDELRASARRLTDPEHDAYDPAEAKRRTAVARQATKRLPFAEDHVAFTRVQGQPPVASWKRVLIK